MAGLKKDQSILVTCLLLILVTLACYSPVLRCGFINYDDPAFFTENIHVQAGLTWNSLAWAFRLGEGDYWHPLTWLSYMVDVELFGKGPVGPHFTNLLLHGLNTALLFILLIRMTGARWRSAMVAGLFALHPLRVESVAWVTERKDVLSAFFGLLSLIFYARYARLKTNDRQPATGNYLMSLFLFACGLMSKAMLVTWPFVMLLLDYWPLNRMSGVTSYKSSFTLQATSTSRLSPFDPRLLWRLTLEKSPFFALSLMSGMITVLTAKKSMTPIGELSVTSRIENAFVSYGRYLGKTLWPVHLAVYYPLNHWSWMQVIGAVILVVGLCVAVLSLGRRRPYLPVGWFWFLITLSLVIGVIQVCDQSIADRFTYVPSIGFFLLLVWGIGEIFVRWNVPKRTIALAAVLVLTACCARTTGSIALLEKQ